MTNLSLVDEDGSGAGSELDITAASARKINAVIFAGSVAIAGGMVGVAVAGAGVGAGGRPGGGGGTPWRFVR